MRPRLHLPTAGVWPLDGNGYNTQISVTLGANDTKGSWQTMFASLPFDASGFYLKFNEFAASGVDRNALWDFAIGPSGGPTILLENWSFSAPNHTTQGHFTPFLPLHMPAGSEVLMRGQNGHTGAVNVPIDIAAVGTTERGVLSYRHATTYGADTANSRGTVLPVTAVNTYGAWTEVTAATSEDHYALGVGLAATWDPGFRTAVYAVDVAIGAASSEVPIYEALTFQTTTSEIHYNTWPSFMPLPYSVFIPAGTRIAARGMTTDAGTPKIPPNITVHGFSSPVGFHSRRRLASSAGVGSRLQG